MLTYEIQTDEHEICFYIDSKSYAESNTPEREALRAQIDVWIRNNLVHHVDFGERPYKQGVNKTKHRRWLNRNIAGRWTYMDSGVSFDDQKDAAIYKLFFG